MIIIYNKSCFRPHFSHQGEFVGETLTQASLPMHHTRARLGVAVTGLSLATLYEISKSIPLKVESECRRSPLFPSMNEYLMFWPAIEELWLILIHGK